MNGKICLYWDKCADANLKCDRCANKKKSYFKEIKSEELVLSEECLADIAKFKEEAAAIINQRSLQKYFNYSEFPNG